MMLKGCMFGAHSEGLQCMTAVEPGDDCLDCMLLICIKHAAASEIQSHTHQTSLIKASLAKQPQHMVTQMVDKLMKQSILVHANRLLHGRP